MPTLQPSPEPFIKEDVVKLLARSVSPKRVAELAHERGVDFQLTPEPESQLRTSGADDGLLSTLKQLAPKPEPAAPAVLASGLWLSTQASVALEFMLMMCLVGRPAPRGD